MNGDTTAHTSPLAALRRGIILALCGVLAIVGAVALVLIAQVWLVRPRYCDPSARPPVSQTLLGQVQGHFVGSVWIHFTASDLSPASFSYISDGPPDQRRYLSRHWPRWGTPRAPCSGCRTHLWVCLSPGPARSA